MTEPKQHHYIPKTYLEQFCDSEGVLWVYDKWNDKSFPSRPPSVLKKKLYYAQPDHKNKVWNHDIENFFSKRIETSWPETVSLIQSGPQYIKELHNLYMWMYSLRVRVPRADSG